MKMYALENTQNILPALIKDASNLYFKWETISFSEWVFKHLHQGNLKTCPKQKVLYLADKENECFPFL